MSEKTYKRLFTDEELVEPFFVVDADGNWTVLPLPSPEESKVIPKELVPILMEAQEELQKIIARSRSGCIKENLSRTIGEKR